MDETLQAHASNICLQHPSLPTARLNSEPSVSTTALPVSRRKSDTEETSKQRKLNRGNRLGSDPTQPTTPEKGQKYLCYFYNRIFVFFSFLFSFSFFSNFFLIVKSSISPLIFISITYYYYFKKKTFFFKANTYSLWMVVDGFFFF